MHFHCTDVLEYKSIVYMLYKQINLYIHSIEVNYKLIHMYTCVCVFLCLPTYWISIQTKTPKNIIKKVGTYRKTIFFF